MTLIAPVSSLSIKRAVNLYTIILFLSFGVLLYWLAADRYQTFIDSHENTAKTTSNIVEFQITKLFKEKQREIDIFVEDYKSSFDKLSDNSNHLAFKNILRKHQPDLLSYSILNTTGKTLAGDTMCSGSRSCIEEVNEYLKDNKHDIRLHSNNGSYFFNIISRYSQPGFAGTAREAIFLVSFDVEEITDLLRSTQSDRHNLVLVNKNANKSIGITSAGTVKPVKGALNFEIRNGANLDMVARTRVDETNLYVVDMSDADLFTDYRNKTIKEYGIAFYIFAMIILFMRYILLRQDAKRSAAEEQLKENHEQIKILNHSLEQLSKKDSLTGLYNRRYFDEMIRHEWNRGLRSQQEISCILIDIDHFKKYNDHYGHQAGDKCIKTISDLLKKNFRRSGEVVARYGGEEFIIAMADTGEEEARLSTVKLQLALKRLNLEHAASDTDDYVTISAGLAVYIPNKNLSVEDMIRDADEALYQAKEAGRDRLVVHIQETTGQRDKFKRDDSI
jgi:diguanylate cyclase (GGDEF)-like protein